MIDHMSPEWQKAIRAAGVFNKRRKEWVALEAELQGVTTFRALARVTCRVLVAGVRLELAARRLNRLSAPLAPRVPRAEVRK